MEKRRDEGKRTEERALKTNCTRQNVLQFHARKAARKGSWKAKLVSKTPCASEKRWNRDDSVVDNFTLKAKIRSTNELLCQLFFLVRVCRACWNDEFGRKLTGDEIRDGEKRKAEGTEFYSRSALMREVRAR